VNNKSHNSEKNERKIVDLQKIDYLVGFREIYSWMAGIEEPPQEAVLTPEEAEKVKREIPKFTFADYYREMIEKAGESV